MSDSFEAWVAEPPQMIMGHLETFEVSRAGLVADDYDPDAVVADWDRASTRMVSAYLASVSSSEVPDPVRSQASSTSVLVVPDPGADIRRGDRVKAPDGRTWTVTGFPARDLSPFTGWRPTLVASLSQEVG